MKRLLMVGLSALVLAACDNEETTQKEPEQNTETTSEPTEEVSTDKVISETPINKTVEIKPFKVNIESISLKNRSNLTEDEILDISTTTGEDLSNTDNFNYMDIKYKVENTVDETYIFTGIQEVAWVIDGKQEQIDIFNDEKDFILDDEENDGGEYLGKVNKKGEVGVIIKSDPTKIKKIRMIIGHSMKEEEDGSFLGVGDEQTIELDWLFI
ncbi:MULTISPECIES: hypothetical protein [Peribacillus]|uniref:hypothetical protein n=1 Tax=Peribacillus TaxID=2675229 RepID=UPI001F4D4694|nr:MULTISPECIES: hypothetical protein [unclassified Peribacillus]MCK1982254.1 hypothetical protein [Peribacillus sp. Aquil_B1]MCK2007394.1 hypothetical protein [Peribacillus sp. Aquil_B8]